MRCTIVVLGLRNAVGSWGYGEYLNQICQLLKTVLVSTAGSQVRPHGATVGMER